MSLAVTLELINCRLIFGQLFIDVILGLGCDNVGGGSAVNWFRRFQRDSVFRVGGIVVLGGGTHGDLERGGSLKWDRNGGQRLWITNFPCSQMSPTLDLESPVICLMIFVLMSVSPPFLFRSNETTDTWDACGPCRSMPLIRWARRDTILPI
jgi:hypothetical protein